MARVLKWDESMKRVATDMLIYINELRVMAPTRELAWLATRRALARLQYLVIQDTSMKRILDNEPWVGIIYSTDNGLITKSVTDLKWNKAGNIIAKTKNELIEDPQQLFSFKRLERDS